MFLLLTMETAFNSVYKVTGDSRTLFWRMVSWIMVSLIVLTVGLLSFISNTLSTIFLLNKLHIISIQLLNFIINTILIGTLYIYIPNHLIKWRDGLLGGCVSAFLFEIGRNSFGLYILHLAYYTNIYGTLALIPIFLLWVYISWLIILFGAIFIAEKNKLLASSEYMKRVYK